jgi:hypothetical protein
MKKKKKEIIVIILIVLAIVAFVIAFFITRDKKTVTKSDDICNQISNSKNKKDDFILFIGNDSEESSEVLKEFGSEYSEIKILHISPNKVEDDCLKKELTNINLYDVAKKSSEFTQAFYKDGEYSGFMIGPLYYDEIEKYVVKTGLANKHEIKETTTLEQFESNIKNEYLLIIIGEESARKVVTPFIDNHFKDYKYDIVNKKSVEGGKIQKYVIENYKLLPGYPQVIYFKQGKELLNEMVYNSDEEYKKIVNQIKTIK